MKIENLKLFTEYESQLKRKFPGMLKECECGSSGMHLYGIHVENGKSFYWQMTADAKPVNGDIECTVNVTSENDFYTIKFDESRKPMEMNVANLYHAIKAGAQTILNHSK